MLRYTGYLLLLWELHEKWYVILAISVVFWNFWFLSPTVFTVKWKMNQVYEVNVHGIWGVVAQFAFGRSQVRIPL